MRRVIVLGGQGWFGHLIVEQLARQSINTVVASRRGDADLRIDADDSDSIRAAVRARDLIIDAVGPYHPRSTALVDTAIEIGFDVIDINDDLGYAKRIVAAEARIRTVGIRVLSSASTVSALAAAVVRHSGIVAPVRVSGIIVPASRYSANKGAALSLLRSVGRPIQVWRDGRLQTVAGWSEPRPFTLPLFKRTLTGSLFETADAIHLPRIWPSLREVTTRVDANIPGVNGLLSFASRSGAFRALLQRVTPAGTQLAKYIGSSAGGVGYEIEDTDGQIARYALVSPKGSYLAAVIPIVLAAKRILSGRFEPSGLVPCDQHTDPGELFKCLAESGIGLTSFGEPQ